MLYTSKIFKIIEKHQLRVLSFDHRISDSSQGRNACSLMSRRSSQDGQGFTLHVQQVCTVLYCTVCLPRDSKIFQTPQHVRAIIYFLGVALCFRNHAFSSFCEFVSCQNILARFLRLSSCPLFPPNFGYFSRIMEYHMVAQCSSILPYLCKSAKE